jgi:hypothetical protein
MSKEQQQSNTPSKWAWTWNWCSCSSREGKDSKNKDNKKKDIELSKVYTQFYQKKYTKIIETTDQNGTRKLSTESIEVCVSTKSNSDKNLEDFSKQLFEMQILGDD